MHFVLTRNNWHYGAWVFGPYSGSDRMVIAPHERPCKWILGADIQDADGGYHCFALCVDKVWDFHTEIPPNTRDLLYCARRSWEHPESAFRRYRVQGKIRKTHYFGNGRTDT